MCVNDQTIRDCVFISLYNTCHYRFPRKYGTQKSTRNFTRKQKENVRENWYHKEMWQVSHNQRIFYKKGDHVFCGRILAKTRHCSFGKWVEKYVKRHRGIMLCYYHIKIMPYTKCSVWQDHKMKKQYHPRSTRYIHPPPGTRKRSYFSRIHLNAKLYHKLVKMQICVFGMKVTAN